MSLQVTAACRMQHGAGEEIILIGRSLTPGIRNP